MMSGSLVKVENVSKKFCKSLKLSLWYGIKDTGSELIGHNNSHNILRRSEFWAVNSVSFELKPGDTLGLIGRNGAGKTTLLRMLNGLIKPDTGMIEVRGRMQALIALGAGFNPILSGRENIYVNAAVLGIPKKSVDNRYDEIVEFSGIGDFIEAPVRSYSSGMTVRLGFAVAAHLEPDILLVDEVLAVGDEGFQKKCLDKVGSLKRKGTAIILVSHNMHTITTFANRVILLKEGSHTAYDNVSEGVKEYRKLFFKNYDTDIQKICSGNENIRFYDVNICKRLLSPGESFTISAKYDSKLEYKNVEIDVVIYSSNETGLHFQATNKAYNKVIDLSKGENDLKIKVQDIRINNASGLIAFTVWTEKRSEILFWWKIPIEFNAVANSNGNNFLNVLFEIRKG
jgi:ABC-type polysaccharide/polyol phosphate transport system ATPase subunit